jgi:hypothetical protein
VTAQNETRRDEPMNNSHYIKREVVSHMKKKIFYVFEKKEIIVGKPIQDNNPDK